MRSNDLKKMFTQSARALASKIRAEVARILSNKIFAQNSQKHLPNFFSRKALVHCLLHSAQKSQKHLQKSLAQSARPIASKPHAKVTETHQKHFSRKALGQWLLKSTQKSLKHLQQFFSRKALTNTCSKSNVKKSLKHLHNFFRAQRSRNSCSNNYTEKSRITFSNFFRARRSCIGYYIPRTSRKNTSKKFSRKALGQWLPNSTQKSLKHLQHFFSRKALTSSCSDIRKSINNTFKKKIRAKRSCFGY